MKEKVMKLSDRLWSNSLEILKRISRQILQSLACSQIISEERCLKTAVRISSVITERRIKLWKFSL